MSFEGGISEFGIFEIEDGMKLEVIFAECDLESSEERSLVSVPFPGMNPKIGRPNIVPNPNNSRNRHWLRSLDLGTINFQKT